MNNLIVIGSANTDMVIKLKDLPKPGQTLLGGEFFMNAGGKGANQAVAAARLGGNIVFVTKVGNDIFGKQTIEGLQKESIQTDFVLIDETAPSGTALIMVNEEGENCIAVAPGANSKLSAADVTQIHPIERASFILTQLEIPIETITALVKTKTTQKIILNPAPAQHLDDELLKGLFLITPNETEAAFLTGIQVTDPATAANAASVLLEKGVQNVIITMGRKGAYFKNKTQELLIDAPVVKAVDTTAAGDTFNGALLVALAENKEWEEAIRFAVKAASISVTRLGAQSSVPYRNEIDALL